MSSQLERQLETTQGALADAIRIGEGFQTRLDAALEALRDVEWSGYSFIGSAPCPSCGGEELDGHRDGCLLAAALEGAS